MGVGSLRPWHIMTNYSANEHQPPLGLPRRGDAGYSASAEIGRCRLLRSGRDWEMQATPLRQRLGDGGYSALAEIGRCRVLRFGRD